MYFSTDFGGRIVQLTDALDVFDAVSNHVVALDGALQELGFDTVISSRFAHPDRARLTVPREQLQLTEADVLVVHYYGFSDGLEDWLAEQYCTKLIQFHNITPTHFFADNAKAASFCEKGWAQLATILPAFHHYWGDSQFNINELIKLGAAKERTSVIPIIVEPKSAAGVTGSTGRWLHVGRIAPNKGLVELIELFADVHKSLPDVAKELVFVGGSEEGEGYKAKVAAAIKRSGCAERIRLQGKMTDEERDGLFSSSDIYVSLSEHEGFGVPLIEATHHNLPVLALDRAAVSETLGGNGVFADVQSLRKSLVALAGDRAKRNRLLAKQQENARRFTRESVSKLLQAALGRVLPRKAAFQTVSVVICTYNRRDYLERCLDYLGHQANGNFEVVVVDGPSDDGTDEVLKRNADRVKIVKNPERNLSKSRNLGIDAAAGDIVAFIDDDAIPFDDWIDQILREYNARPLTTAGLGGPAYYAGSLWFQAEDNGINGNCQVKVSIASDQIGKQGWLRYNTGTNATFVREALVAVHGFDEQFDYFLDESELCFRLQKAGWLIGYAPEVIVRHEFAQSHNRKGKHNYNWFTICKNTAYFIATNSGLKGKKLDKFIEQQMQDDRVAPLDKALANLEITEQERDDHVKAVWDGVKQGLADAAGWPRTRAIAARPGDFKAYPIRLDRPAVGRDIPALHICIVSKEFPPFTGAGGVGTLYYHLASELLLMGHEVSVILPSAEDKVHRQGRFTIYFTKQQDYRLPLDVAGFVENMNWSLSALSKLSTIHRERPVDIVDSALWDAETLAFSLVADRPPLVVRLVTPYTVTAAINGWQPSEKQSEYFLEGERALLEAADAVIPISNTIAVTIAKTHSLDVDERWSVGHCGIAPWPSFDVNAGYGDYPELESLQSLKIKAPKLVVFIGRLERRKGLDLILRSAETILRSNPDAVLLFGGRDGENWAARFKQEVPKEFHARMLFLGEVDDGTREKLLAHADCVLFPSLYESFGLVPLEAFVHGAPVVATRAGAIPEVVQDGVSGLLVDPDDHQAFADAVGRILTDRKLKDRLSGGARQRVKQLSARNSATHSVEVYQKLIRTN